MVVVDVLAQYEIYILKSGMYMCLYVHILMHISRRHDAFLYKPMRVISIIHLTLINLLDTHKVELS